MVKRFVNIGLPKKLAEVADDVMEQSKLSFTSRSELLRHLLQKYIEQLVHDKVLTPDILKKMERIEGNSE